MKSQSKKIAKRTLVMRILLPAVFKFNCMRRVNPKKVVLVYEKSFTLPDNLRMVKEELERRNDGYLIKCHLKTEKSKSRLWRQVQNLWSFMKFTADYATAGTVVLEEYYLPVYANAPRKGTHVVQLWHACGAFKKWGWATLDANWGVSREINDRFPMHIHYTHVSVSSKDIIPCYAEAFHTDPAIIHPYGVPRTDVFFEEDFKEKSQAAFYALYPQLKGKKIVLYAPTFRGNSLRKAYNANMLDLPYLQEQLGEEYAIVYKLHPLVAKAFTVPEEYENFAVDASGKIEINPLLSFADILISDYSSLIFEFALMKRPMIFYAYDLEEYVEDRDFFFDYEEMVPGRIVKDNLELVEAIQTAEKDYDEQRMEQFLAFFMSACDGKSTKRIVEEFILKR